MSAGPDCRKDSLPRVDLFGMAVAQLSQQGLLDYFHTSLREGRGQPSATRLIAYANAHSCNLLRRDAAFCQAMQQVDLIYTDGNGPRLAAWLSGQRLPQRMTSADWYPDLCRLCQDQGYSMYLLGAAPGVAALAACRLKEQYPGLVIAGTQHGYFKSEEEREVIRHIREVRPDLLVLGMGSPRQEIWMVHHRVVLEVSVVWAAGGWIDLVAGTKPRPPLWMRRLGLEWLGRLLIEPRRLAARYLFGIPSFLWHSACFAARRRLEWRRR